MLSRYTHKGVVWIDLESPTPGEVRQVVDEFDVHPLVGEELLTQSLKSKVERFDNCLYLILHFPAFGSHLGMGSATAEVDFVLGKDFIITTRYSSLDPFFKFAKLFEAHALLGGSAAPQTGASVFCYMLRHLYLSLEGELDTLSIDLDAIEEKIFEGKEKEMVVAISGVSRVLLNAKQALAPHREVLDSLESSGVKFFGADFGYHLRSVMGGYIRVASNLDIHREALTELRETNNALLNSKQNEIMKVLTIMAFITLPLTLVTSTLGMNTKYLPIVGLPGDFWIVLAIMLFLGGSLSLFFRRKKWL